jgi:hypothetical protein
VSLDRAKLVVTEQGEVANDGAVILNIILAFNLKMATVPFDKLLRNKQTNSINA